MTYSRLKATDDNISDKYLQLDRALCIQDSTSYIPEVTLKGMHVVLLEFVISAV